LAIVFFKSVAEKDLEIERKYAIQFGPLKLSHLHFIYKEAIGDDKLDIFCLV